MIRTGLISACAFSAIVFVAAAGARVDQGKPLSGSVTADGSSTVGPYTTAAAEGFEKRNPKARVTVGVSGTGGGFERFCRNETDLSNASRPMKDSEAIKCRDAGVKWLAFTVANDGLSVVVNRSNTWANCLTVAELKKVWEPGSKVDNWSQVRDGFPNVSLKLFGAGTDSGTFDYFTEAINGKSRASRSDYLATEDDNVVVTGVQGERGALGYFGFSYYEENKDKLKVLAIDSGKGGGCVTPSIATVQANKYRPLSRPLFIYAKRDSFKRPVVAGFFGYIFNNEKAIATQAGFIALTDRQLKKARYTYRVALKANSK
ncbi:MAG: PstS family phosphate ABC transporter substrate-binding protein [Actinomycetota bacterium]|nr:PstS family phosphate ABC transporter substrate-binding protein [Actinomycetota bacterium]